jgi:NAD(P)-dependent dehydrogenase (short-subunit alcohol dehydrogenase family)
MQLKDKVVIVTGAATHIGQAYAVRLAKEGAKVVACDILDCGTTAEMVIEAGGEVLPLITDVTKEEDTIEMARQTVERFGRIDCIVNNAGIFDGLTARPMMDVDMAEWDKVYEVNVKGMFLCCRAVFPYMKEQGGGKIINIGSGIWLQGMPGVPHYVSSKAAVMGLTRTLAKELGQFNINVNTLAPGGTDSGAKIGRGDDAPIAPSRAGRSIPRIETPEDLTGTMVFLASEDSNFITGQMITINGGDALY